MNYKDIETIPELIILLNKNRLAMEKLFKKRDKEIMNREFDVLHSQRKELVTELNERVN